MVSTEGNRYLALACGALPGLFLLITSTTHLVEGEFVYDVKRMLQLCLMLVLFLAAALNPGMRNAFALQLGRIPTWLKALLGLIIALGITSSVVNATSGMHLAYSLLEVALLSMLVLAALIIAACRAVAGELFDQVAITLLAISAIAVGIQELVGVAAVLAEGLEFHAQISLIYYAHTRFYNQVQSWTLPVIAALPLLWSLSRSELLRSTWFQAIVCLGALTLHWYIILMTGGRGVALSLLVAFVVCLWIFPAIRKPSLKWHLSGIVLGAGLFFAIAQLNEPASRGAIPTAAAGDSAPLGQASRSSQRPNESTESRFAEQSLVGRLSLNSSGRLGMWRDSVRDIRADPLLGIGPMNYACTGPPRRAGHPHNFALQFAGEWGIPAMVALLVAIAFSATVIWSVLHQRGTPGFEPRLGALLATGLVAAAVYSFLSGVMVMPASQVTGILVGGWIMGLIPALSRKSGARSIPACFVLMTGMLVAATTTGFSWIELKKREYREGIVEMAAFERPRYWQHGRLCRYFDEF